MPLIDDYEIVSQQVKPPVPTRLVGSIKSNNYAAGLYAWMKPKYQVQPGS